MADFEVITLPLEEMHEGEHVTPAIWNNRMNALRSAIISICQGITDTENAIVVINETMDSAYTNVDSWICVQSDMPDSEYARIWVDTDDIGLVLDDEAMEAMITEKIGDITGENIGTALDIALAALDMPSIATDAVNAAVEVASAAIEEDLAALLESVDTEVESKITEENIPGKVAAAVTAANITGIINNTVIAQDIPGKVDAAIAASDLPGALVSALADVDTAVAQAIVDADIEGTVEDYVLASLPIASGLFTNTGAISLNDDGVPSVYPVLSSVLLSGTTLANVQYVEGSDLRGITIPATNCTKAMFSISVSYGGASTDNKADSNRIVGLCSGSVGTPSTVVRQKVMCPDDASMEVVLNWTQPVTAGDHYFPFVYAFTDALTVGIGAVKFGFTLLP